MLLCLQYLFFITLLFVLLFCFVNANASETKTKFLVSANLAIQTFLILITFTYILGWDWEQTCSMLKLTSLCHVCLHTCMFSSLACVQECESQLFTCIFHCHSHLCWLPAFALQMGHCGLFVYACIYREALMLLVGKYSATRVTLPARCRSVASVSSSWGKLKGIFLQRLSYALIERPCLLFSSLLESIIRRRHCWKSLKIYVSAAVL